VTAWHAWVLADPRIARTVDEMYHRRRRKAAYAVDGPQIVCNNVFRVDPDERAAITARELIGDRYDDDDADGDGTDSACGHEGELWDPRDPNKRDYVEIVTVDQTGTQIKATWTKVIKAPAPKQFPSEYCRLCDWPVKLTVRECEFPYMPRLWWRDDRPHYCHCNPCLPRKGKQRYCGDCTDRGDNLQDRIRRFRNGATPRRTADAVADRIVFYAADMIYRARNPVGGGRYVAARGITRDFES
jgi:hypothetical protein